jgi:signal transduction histidine kinase
MPSTTVEDYPRLLSLAVHEFRTPASVVGGYLRMLQRDAEPLTPRQRKMIDEAEKSCARLVTLIGEMSDIGKLDSGALALMHQPLQLGPLLAEVAEHVHEAKDRDVRLVLRDDGSSAPLSGDAVRLRSTFDAIFRAILREKAGPATVVANRRCERIDGRPWCLVVVADESSVQDVYNRPRDAFDEKRGGMGLALPLARRVIEGHGGHLWSPAPESGRSEAEDATARSSAFVALPLTE